ncbi:hypothetical protein GGQ08_001393 [Salinibacter ruber]|uniref:hypothetical protein n=1 Tax=Salinibacter ruber TaxID=146919 RepID=UPI001ABA96CE|nr:hypothetical protein [Salinibacter ruber]MCS3650099.1 hypothetical protein [Salinibacter ruber]MCS3653353.1 hypothetical protein [Salinibacter ruber]
MRPLRLRYATGLALCLMLAAGPAWAQQQGTGGMQAGGTAYYTFARPGQNTIEVLVLGGQSGIYEVGENINMGQLVALAGGGRGGGRTNVTVRHFRLKDGKRRKILDQDLDEFTERAQYPSLQDGDVIRLETSQGWGWREVLQITTAVTSLTFTVLRIFDIGR